MTAPGPVTRIIVRYGGQTWRVTPERAWTIGRAKTADIHLDDPRISRNQATLEATPEGWFLVNQGRNGMFVGGRRVDRLAVKSPVSVTLGPPEEGVTLQLHPRSAAAADATGGAHPPP